ncbi:MAG: hypothetical protein JWQ04_1445 [Pedosphaera sp.]|nr:hypothetical protein [Pedosphaera sp.]
MAAGKINPMIDLFKSKRPSTILGLAFDGNQLEAVVLRRTNGHVQVRESVSKPLALSLLSGDPALVGRELRNHLNEAGIRERRCAVCLPLNWVLTMHTQIPDLPEADIESFLQLEAERGFPAGHENLYIAHSRARAADGTQFATLMGIPRNHLASVQAALKAAQLKPLTFSLGITALAGAVKDAPGSLTLALANHGIDLQVTAGGGIAALRSLDGAVEVEGSQKRIDADLVARELRITLGQLPPVFAGQIRTAKIFGRGELARQFVTDIARRTETMGLKVDLMERATDAEFNQPAAPEIALSPALALAASYLRETATGPEFLPPRVSPWQQMMTSTKFSSQKLMWAGGAAGAVAACVAGAFLFQQWQISRLDSRWKAMESKVTELNTDQSQIQKYRPWFDRSFRALRILRALTQSFPEDGYVSAKSLEIRDQSSVTCSGNARDNQSYIKLLDQLSNIPEISDLKTESVRGQTPVQFTLNFQWEGGKASGN